MRHIKFALPAAILLTCATAGVSSGRADTPDEAAARIRTEGLEKSRAMHFAQALSDGIGSRLTASPAYDRAVVRTLATLREIGLKDVHAEDIGPFGMAWEEGHARLALARPRRVALAAQVAPWSASGRGTAASEVVAATIASLDDLPKYRGTLRGRIVFLGAVPKLDMPFQPLATRYRTADPETLGAAPAQYFARRAARMGELASRTRFRRALGEFLVKERVSAVVLPSRNADDGGSGLLTGDDSGMPVVSPWLSKNQLPFPVLYTTIEDFGLVVRLAEAGERPRVRYDVATRVAAQTAHAANVVGEMAGDDARLAAQIVLVGAHLDSWIGGTGATDDGAGVAICLEAMRILKASGVRMRRTVRIVLYAGEEQGLLGSLAYAKRHFGSVPRSTAPAQRDIPVEGWRMPIGAATLLPDHARLSVAFNVDGGSGRIRGLFTGGNPAMAAVLRDWIGPLRELGVGSVVDAPTWPADQTSFTDLGLPAIDFAQDPLDYDTRAHHTNMDRSERLSRDDLAQAATVLATLVMKAANSDDPMPRLTKQPRR